MPRSNPLAISRWKVGVRRFFSSVGLEINAVSTSIDGTSGDFSTMKLACWTRAM